MALHPAKAELAHEIRDCLATEFAVSVSSEQAAAAEILEHQLASTQDRERWRPLRLAIEALRDLAPSLRGLLEARVRERFDAKLSPERDKFSQTARFSLDSLSLVSEDEVQEEIAIGNAARRLREATANEFYALNSRLSTALDLPRFADEHSPVHPRVFARSVLDALAGAASDHAARLAVFAALDPAILHALPKALKAANEILVRRGVLPNLRRSYGAPRQVPGARASMHGMSLGHSPGADAAAAPPPPAAPATDADAPHALFDRLLATAATSAAPVPAAAGLVTLQVRPELVEALRRLEAGLGSSSASLGVGTVPAGPGGDSAPVQHSPDVVRRARAEMADTLTPADALVADLVAAMFGRLFEDPEVSDSAKVQLARLQLPVFKAVMADRRFFTDPSHPIRGLIDTIAELGASGEGIHVEGRLPGEWLAQETQALLDGNQLDAAAFATARDHLARIAERHHEAVSESDAVVRSLRRDDAEVATRQEAALEVAHRIAATECPTLAAAFAYRAWRPVMEHDHRTAGIGAPQWKADLETLDDLLWTLTPRITAVERKRLETLMPSVRFRMWQSLIRAQLPSETIESLLDELDRIHAVLQHAPLAAAQGELATTVALAPAARDDFTATLHINSEEIREEGLSRGSWYEFTEGDGTTRRARLAWVSPIQGACVFKDIARNRSFAISLADLRDKRQQGLARPVDGPGVAHSSIEAALRDVARERGAMASP